MAQHFCQYTVSYEKDFKAIRCDKPAPIKHEDGWLCAEHYDLIEESFSRAAEHGKFWGVDFGMSDDLPATFPPDFDDFEDED